MKTRMRAAVVAALATSALALGVAPAAQANVLSLLSGCGGEVDSHPFAQWGDNSNYVPAPGGNFESGPSWLLTGGAQVADGNESFQVGGASDAHSLSLPAGSSATSPAQCTGIDHPTLRLFARNTGASSSRLNVDAYYPGLLGGTQRARIGSIAGSGDWQPTGASQLTLTNLLATLSLSRTVVAFRFSPADSAGNWSIDDVYVDPYARR